jgi:hypothetical protein
MVDVENMPTIPRWIRRQVEKGDDAKALKIANYLNTDSNSPWLNKIRMANDEGADATINQRSFINSIKKYIFSANNPLADPSFDEKRPQMLSNYWKAIVELLVDPESSKTSVVFKTSGVDLFHISSATVFLYLANRRDFTKDTIKEVLRRGFGNLSGENIGMASPEWWQRGSKASDLNSAGVRKLGNALSLAINVQDGAGEITI